MLLFLLSLTIFSGGLFLIDVILLGLAFWFFYQAKQGAKKEGGKFYQRKIFILSCLSVAAWIVTLIMRAGDI